MHYHADENKCIKINRIQIVLNDGTPIHRLQKNVYDNCRRGKKNKSKLLLPVSPLAYHFIRTTHVNPSVTFISLSSDIWGRHTSKNGSELYLKGGKKQKGDDAHSHISWVGGTKRRIIGMQQLHIHGCRHDRYTQHAQTKQNLVQTECHIGRYWMRECIIHVPYSGEIILACCGMDIERSDEGTCKSSNIRDYPWMEKLIVTKSASIDYPRVYCFKRI